MALCLIAGLDHAWLVSLARARPLRRHQMVLEFDECLEPGPNDLVVV